MEFIKEFMQFLRQRKKFWLVPLILVLFLLSVIVVLTASSAIAPFVYTIF